MIHLNRPLAARLGFDVDARSPDGSLELFLPAAGSYGAPQTVPTGYEPIRRDVAVGWRGRPVLSDAAWRWQAMGRLGFAHDATDERQLKMADFVEPLVQGAGGKSRDDEGLAHVALLDLSEE